jgi:hypothetical protein
VVVVDEVVDVVVVVVVVVAVCDRDELSEHRNERTRLLCIHDKMGQVCNIQARHSHRAWGPLAVVVVVDVVPGVVVVVLKPTVAAGPSTLMGMVRDAMMQGRPSARGVRTVSHLVLENGSSDEVIKMRPSLRDASTLLGSWVLEEKEACGFDVRSGRRRWRAPLPDMKHTTTYLQRPHGFVRRRSNKVLDVENGPRGTG